MGYNCSLTEKIIGILVIVFAWWTIESGNISAWILTILGLSLIWHAFRCTNCNVSAGNVAMKQMPVKKSARKPAKKSSKKRKK